MISLHSVFINCKSSAGLVNRILTLSISENSCCRPEATAFSESRHWVQPQQIVFQAACISLCTARPWNGVQRPCMLWYSCRSEKNETTTPNKNVKAPLHSQRFGPFFTFTVRLRTPPLQKFLFALLERVHFPNSGRKCTWLLFRSLLLRNTEVEQFCEE